MQEKPDIAALVGSRICHDLISPIGAIGNGVELFLMESALQSPEFALITESVNHASARIRFFRIAFGATTADHSMASREVSSILQGMAVGSRVGIGWTGPESLSRRDVKLAFLLILCLETALPYGGQIEVARGATRWTLRATAPRLNMDAALWECLITPTSMIEFNAAQVQFLLVPEEIERQHRRLSIELLTQEIRLSF